MLNQNLSAFSEQNT